MMLSDCGSISADHFAAGTRTMAAAIRTAQSMPGWHEMTIAACRQREAMLPWWDRRTRRLLRRMRVEAEAALLRLADGS